MVSISGSVGKIEALFNYIIDLNSSAVPTPSFVGKKRQLDQNNEALGHIHFPVSVPGIDLPTLRELLSNLGKFEREELEIEWSFDTVCDTVIASMRVYPQGGQECIVSNDCMLMGAKFKDNQTEMIEDSNQLFVAMAYAARQSLLTAYNIKLTTSTDGGGLGLQLDLKFDMERAKEQNALRLMTVLSRHTDVEIIESNERPVKKNKQKATSSSSFTPLNLSNVTVSSANLSNSIASSSTMSSSTPSSSNSPSSRADFSVPPSPVDMSLTNFYANLHPPVSNDFLEQYTSPSMTSVLTPFQTQNVEWMIKREGHIATVTGNIIQLPQSLRPLPLLHTGTHTDESSGMYYNLFTESETKNRASIEKLTDRSLKGGILADEMGLGKTVSVLGLISKHQLNINDSSHPHPSKYPELIVSKATLIIAPSAIMSQWNSEIKKHTPNLKVYQYKGASKESIDAKLLAEYDIVLVFYETFKTEISHSQRPPQRSRRHAAKYEFNISSLVSILWFRCVLDEAQMVESVTAKVATMANRIPRWYSWAVTGTPLKTKFDELFGLYNFLRLENSVCTNANYFWNLHASPENKGLFFDFTKATMRRNTKSALESQVVIPKQTRHVVHIPFSTIEQHYYEDLYKRCKADLRLDWLDSIGWEISDSDSEINKSLFEDSKSQLRPWLLALRQNCIHPSVISNPTFKLGNQSTSTSSSSRKVQSLTDVLNDMAKSARNMFDNHQYAYYVTKLKLGGMYEIIHDWHKAAENYRNFIPKVKALVQFHTEQFKINRDNKAVQLYLENDTAGSNDEGRKRDRWNMLLHQYYFYLAGVCHQLQFDGEEEICYAQASDIRHVLLEKYITKIEVSLRELSQNERQIQSMDEHYVGPRAFDEDLLKFKQYSDEDSDMDDSDDEENLHAKERDRDINFLQNLKRIGVILDEQYDKIHDLRKKAMKLLKEPVIDNSVSSENVAVDDYEESIQKQALTQAYITAYQNLLQDRKFMIKGMLFAPVPIETHNHKENKTDESKLVEDEESKFRSSLKSPGFQLECIKDLDVFLRSLKNTMNGDEPEYFVLIENQQWLKRQMPFQNKLIDDMDTDVRKLLQSFNSRVAFYKSLQTISDTLLDWQHEDPQSEIIKLSALGVKLEEEIMNSKSRDSYFKVLAEDHKNLGTTDEKAPKDCLICQETIEKGMITYCGHTSCIDCGLLWFKQNQRCHTCNSTVRPNEWYSVSYKDMQMHDKDARLNPIIISNGSHKNVGSHSDGIIEGSSGQLNSLIQKITTEIIVPGQGAKLDSIIRHIMFIKNDTNGKCVVFSQWNSVLDMLKTGLDKNGIKCVALTSGTNNSAVVTKFQKDPTINVILLHARSQSSGLTLVEAQTVFIVEPVFNVSLEKQAINRVHRIGQTKETSAFWYIVQDTIEERIQAIHNRKRNINVAEIDDKVALSKLTDGGGEVVAEDDICLCFTNNENMLSGHI